MQREEEHIKKDVCGLNSKLVSTISTQIQFILCEAKVEQALRPVLNLFFFVILIVLSPFSNSNTFYLSFNYCMQSSRL